jgi:hypothetical protein
MYLLFFVYTQYFRQIVQVPLRSVPLPYYPMCIGGSFRCDQAAMRETDRTIPFSFFFYVLLTLHFGIILVNNLIDAQFFSVYVYSDNLQVTSIRAHHQGNKLYQYDIWHMSLYVGECLACRYGWNSIHTCIPDGHLKRVTYARCHIDTVDAPDDEHMVARNM